MSVTVKNSDVLLNLYFLPVDKSTALWVWEEMKGSDLIWWNLDVHFELEMESLNFFSVLLLYFILFSNRVVLKHIIYPVNEY